MIQAAVQSERPKKAIGSPEHEVYLNIARTHAVLAARFDRLFRHHGTSAPQYNILRILRLRGDEGLPIREIADRMTTCVPDMTRLMDRLQRAGLIRRERSLKDRRVILVKLTPRGTEFLGALDPSVRELDREVLGHLSGDELAAINRLMAKARQAENE